MTEAKSQFDEVIGKLCGGEIKTTLRSSNITIGGCFKFGVCLSVAHISAKADLAKEHVFSTPLDISGTFWGVGKIYHRTSCPRLRFCYFFAYQGVFSSGLS